MDLNGAGMVKAISSNVAAYVTVNTFVKALRALVIEELKPQLLDIGRTLSETVAFPWSWPTLSAKKCIFNLVPCDNEFEKEFANFLEKAPDVGRFAKLPQQFGFVIEYTDAAGNLRYYEPDFVAVLDNPEPLYLLELLGQTAFFGTPWGTQESPRYRFNWLNTRHVSDAEEKVMRIKTGGCASFDPTETRVEPFNTRLEKRETNV